MKSRCYKSMVCGLVFCAVTGVTLQAQNGLTLSIGQNLKGSTFGTDSPDVPADANGAVGPQHFVEFINGRFSVYTKSGGSRVQTFSDTQFWVRAGLSIKTGWSVTDPRIIYDPSVQRWFASQIDFDPTLTVNTNRFLVAVSATADPTGTWKGVALAANAGGNNFADFPTLGLDAQGVYLAGDLFDKGGNAIGSTLVSIPKSALLASTPDASGRTSFGVLSYASRGEIIQPVVCLDGSASGTALAPSGLGFNDITGNLETNTTLIGFHIQNAASSGGATLTGSTVLNVPGFTAPLNPFQPDGTSNLDDGDSRFSAQVRCVGGVIYAVQSTEVNNLAALRWYRINAGNLSLLESGTITNSVLDLYYPSIAANSNGTVVIACNGSSITTFISAYATVGQTVNGVTSFGGLTLLKSGVASYHKPDTTSISRWGDYSATTVDPVDPTHFWTIQIIPAGTGTWSTQFTELIATSLRLAISLARTNVQISWSTNSAGFKLESAPSLSPGGSSWSQVAQPPSIIGSQFSVLVPATSGQQYFRLHQGP